jgi:hypothetical protein
MKVRVRLCEKMEGESCLSREEGKHTREKLREGVRESMEGGGEGKCRP